MTLVYELFPTHLLYRIQLVIQPVDVKPWWGAWYHLVCCPTSWTSTSKMTQSRWRPSTIRNWHFIQGVAIEMLSSICGASQSSPKLFPDCTVILRRWVVIVFISVTQQPLDHYHWWYCLQIWKLTTIQTHQQTLQLTIQPRRSWVFYLLKTMVRFYSIIFHVDLSFLFRFLNQGLILILYLLQPILSSVVVDISNS